ncbi:DSBA-like thioredoxin domain-containing protein [Xylariaceae sp. FL1651]|nr:DSBA-like thioredoxin domain-containing protein [Xylariaceae sp. FL1651]
MAIIEIDVVSDFWCYIGKRKLESAISLYQKVYPGGKNDVFQVTWRPYYLSYNTTGRSMEKSELAAVKLADWSQEKKTAATKRFKHGGMIGPHTRDAHRLAFLSRAKPPEVTSALVDKLFEAYHEFEKDISSLDVLRQVALDSNVAADAVDEEAQIFRGKVASSGVPSYFIQEIHRLDGAQDAEDFMELFVKIKENSTVMTISRP